ncbi:MAG: response regulator [Thermodesulfobacteriota bacterium]
MKNILVVEDERDIRELICHHLKKEGFRPLATADAETAYAEVQKRLPDAILLDLMLPGMQGLELCRILRGKDRTSRVPILILTAKEEEIDKLVGFEMGADDYISKPFSPRELIARLRAVLRRAGEAPSPEQRPPYESGALYLNFATYEVRVRNKLVALSPIEFRLLRHLVTHPEIVFSRDQLLDSVWGRDTFVMPRTVDVHVQKLRSLIEKDPRHPKMILTVRGAGYKFQPDTK